MGIVVFSGAGDARVQQRGQDLRPLLPHRCGCRVLIPRCSAVYLKTADFFHSTVGTVPQFCRYISSILKGTFPQFCKYFTSIL